MRFLHLSDLHLGRSLFEYSLLEDQRFWCREVLDFLEKSPCDAVVIAGDLYDRSVPGADAVALCDWFLGELAGRLRLPVLCISGNHDSPQRLGFASSLYRAGGLYMAALPRRELERVAIGDQWGEVDFFLLPYLTPGDGRTLFPEREVRTFQDAYQAMIEENRPALDRSRRKVLVAHGFFAPLSHAAGREDSGLIFSDSEVSVGGSDLVGAGLFEDFSYCAFGHLHACQPVGKNGRMWYCGSPLKYSVSEEKQQKSALLVTLDGQGDVQTERLIFPPRRELRCVRGTMDQLLAPTGGGFASEDYVQITVLTQGTEIEASRRLRNVYPNYLQIRYENPASRRLTLSGHGELSRLTMDEAYLRFYRQVTGQELDDDGKKLLRKISREAQQRREEEVTL